MAGETAAWREAAVGIFASFGDAVKDVTVKLYSGSKTFNATLGRNEQGSTTSTSKLAIVMLGQTKFQKAFGPTAAYAEGHKTGYMLPTATGTLKLGDEVVDGSDRYIIDKLADPSGTAAYYIVYLRPVKN